MKSRIRYKIGDVFLIPYEDGRIGAGRILKKDKVTVFVELYKIMPITDRSDFDWNNTCMKETIVMDWKL